MYALNVESIVSDVSCCQGSCYGSFPFCEGSEVNLLVCEDEFGRGFLRIVDENDNKSRNQQDRDNDGCEDCAFGHGLHL